MIFKTTFTEVFSWKTFVHPVEELEALNPFVRQGKRLKRIVGEEFLKEFLKTMAGQAEGTLVRQRQELDYILPEFIWKSFPRGWSFPFWFW